VTIDVPEVDQLISTGAALCEEVAALRLAVHPQKSWYTKNETAALKGVNRKTLDANPYLWPNFGRGKIVGRTMHFRAADVNRWLDKSDEQIEREYRVFREKMPPESVHITERDVTGRIQEKKQA